MKKEEQLPNVKTITTQPFPNSKKIFVKGELNDIQVAMREITLSDTHTQGKAVVKNAPVALLNEDTDLPA